MENSLELLIRQHIEEEDGDANEVKYLSLKNKKLRTMSGLEIMPNIIIIDLRNNELTEIWGFQKCLNLKELYLCENRITKIRNLQTLFSLQLIDLRGNHMVSVLGLSCSLPTNLTKLMIRCNNLVQISKIIKVENKFEVLWVDENLFISVYCHKLGSILRSKSIDPNDFWF